MSNQDKKYTFTTTVDIGIGTVAYSVSYTAKKTRHKNSDRWRLTFSDGLKKTIGYCEDRGFYVYITDRYFLHRYFEDMDSVAEFAYECRLKEIASARETIEFVRI